MSSRFLPLRRGASWQKQKHCEQRALAASLFRNDLQWALSVPVRHKAPTGCSRFMGLSFTSRKSTFISSGLIAFISRSLVWTTTQTGGPPVPISALP